MTVWSAAPQTTLWEGSGPRFEPGPGGSETGTLPLDHHAYFKKEALRGMFHKIDMAN